MQAGSAIKGRAAVGFKLYAAARGGCAIVKLDYLKMAKEIGYRDGHTRSTQYKADAQWSSRQKQEVQNMAWESL